MAHSELDPVGFSQSRLVEDVKLSVEAWGIDEGAPPGEEVS